MITKSEARDEVIEALERVYASVATNDPFEVAYEIDYVSSYILGIQIEDLENEVSDDPDDLARFASIRVQCSHELDAFAGAVERFVEGGPDKYGDRKSHELALELLNILDSLK